MNVIAQNLTQRLFIIVVVTLMASYAIYFLEYSSWAESIRQALLAPEAGEVRQERGYAAAVLGSLMKACLLTGIPILLTLTINRVRLRTMKK